MINKKYILHIFGLLVSLLAVNTMSSSVFGEELVYAGQTDRGSVRPQNEDSLAMIPELGFFIAADGMGGAAAGEVASARAAETISSFVRLPIYGLLDNVLPFFRADIAEAGYHEANRRIFDEAARDASKRGMGTTAVSLIVREKAVDIINVGDSRAYRLRSGNMVQISHDHSLVQQLIDTGELKTPEEIEAFPYKNIITQAMGTQPTIVPDIFTHPRVSGDIYLLCSDGLTNELSEDAIAGIILAHTDDLDWAARSLVQKAKDAGGRDNITVILVKIQH